MLLKSVANVLPSYQSQNLGTQIKQQTEDIPFARVVGIYIGRLLGTLLNNTMRFYFNRTVVARFVGFTLLMRKTSSESITTTKH